MGFFDLGVDIPEAPVKRRGLSSSGTAGGCDACGRFQNALTPRMGTLGEGRKKILIVGEYPGRTDDRLGRHFAGESGALLRDFVEQLGFDLDEDCWCRTAVQCGSPKESDAGPDPVSFNSCRSKLLRSVQELQPQVIITLGTAALGGLIGDRVSGRIKKVQLTQYFGEVIPDRNLNAWVCPTYSVQWLHKHQRAREEFKLFQKHLVQALNQVGKPFPYLPSIINLTEDPQEAIRWINDARERAPEIAIDYETTGLKPQAEGHHITIASMAWRPNGDAGEIEGFGFPYFKDAEFRQAWIRLLRDPRVGKIAHKADFEWAWTRFRAGVDDGPAPFPSNLSGDTCLAAHCIGNNKPTGLKFHTYTKLGVLGYDDAADAFIKAPDESRGCNSFNRMDDCPFSVGGPYCTLDSMFSLALKQGYQADAFRKEPEILPGYHFFMEGIQAFSAVQAKGISLDSELLEAGWRKLEVQIAEARQKLMDTPEAQRLNGGFNPDSNPQLAKLLYDVLGLKGEKGRSVDEESLEALGTPFTQSILEYRGLVKLIGYFEQYRKETVGGVLRPFMTLNIADTFRSSCTDPNFQNVPKRDKVAKKIIRSPFRPAPGCRIVEYDYKGVEVSGGACYHKDPQMIKYIEDPTTDMHRDVGMELFFRLVDELSKPERQAAKNGFTFPEFYGSSWANVAPGVWKQLDSGTKEHLAKHGIKDLGTVVRDKNRRVIEVTGFYAHVKAIEEKFWGERFKGYSRWKNQIHKSYQQLGYVELYTGFRCRAPLEFTQATNSQIQGSSFHILLRTLIKVQPLLPKLPSGQSFVMGQIHDALVANIHPDDEERADRLVWHYGTQEVRKAWPWIIVPLTIEKERSEIGGSWAEMKDCGPLKFGK